jgi:hypothetical protein
MDPIITLGLIIAGLILGLTFWLYKDDLNNWF